MLRGMFWALLLSLGAWVALIAFLAQYYKPEALPTIPPLSTVPVPTPRPDPPDEAQVAYCAEYMWQLVRQNPMMPPVAMHLPTQRFLQCTQLDPASAYRNGTNT